MSGDLGWMDDGVCRELDRRLFFAVDTDPDTARAKRACLRCPVVDSCHEYAMGQPVWLDGVWGGRTPADRRRIRRKRYAEAERAKKESAA